MVKEVVLIHGAFAGPWCWDSFKSYFQNLGWTCHTPTLRYHDVDPSKDPNPDLAHTSIRDYTDDIAAFVRRLKSPPIILGHAIGALIAQQVASRGLARGLVLINPNAAWGMLPATNDERAVARTFMESGPFWKAPMRVAFELIAPFALNKLDTKTQKQVFSRLVPESGQVMFEMFFWMFDDNRSITVEFEKVRCPVLVVAGEEDRAVRHAVGKEIAEKYGNNGSFLLASGQAHFLFMEPGRESVANSWENWTSKAASQSI